MSRGDLGPPRRASDGGSAQIHWINFIARILLE
jgi:hypothetical protein